MDWRYMSATYFKKFMKCEADALDCLQKPRETTSTALIIGNYLHSWFQGEEPHEQFIADNKDMLFTKNGKKRADTVKCDAMIERLEKDKLFNFFYQNDQCQKEVVLSGTIAETEWKARIDCLNIEKGYFCDLKTTADLHKRYWSKDKHSWVSFIDAYNYALQMIVYKKLLQQKYHKPFNCYIFAVDKTAVPGIAAIEMPIEDMLPQLDVIRDYMPRVKAIMNGEEEPESCGICDFCKSNQPLTGFINPRQLLID